MRLLICAMALSAAAYASVIGGAAESNPVRTHPHRQTEPAVQRVIVKLRSLGGLGPGSASAASASVSVSAHDRVASLAVRSGLTMRESHAIFDRLQVMQVEPVAGESMAATLERLKADPDVEYAVPDGRKYIHAVPTDTRYLTGQWYEAVNATTPAAVDAQDAWDVTTGDPNVVIADLDTGVRFDHPDLLAVAASGRLLPGYDFVHDASVANDGDGRDTDASDPGDWVSSTDISSNSVFKDCTAQPISSWHGTRTAGILGALSNNAHGVAGMTWQGKILPVRVLGKCGGFDSDILAAMTWAAGISVTGVTDNPNPARIINMSLGSSETCPQSYADVISQLTAMGVLVVVSAGNEGGPVDAPANCVGVAGVAGIRHVGTKVGFSSLGPEVAVSAPAGNCVNVAQGQPCVYSIQTTSNSGATTPVPNDDAYTGTQIVPDTTPLGPNLGTSFSAPIVSGITALMVAANSNLTTCQLISRLKEGSVPFPQTSPGETPQPAACHVPTSASDVSQTSECICTLDGKTCGAGMANAKGAVNAALRPIAAVTLPTSVAAGQSISLNAQTSAAANGHAISTYQWTNVGKQSVSIQNATSAAASVTAPSCGYATVQVVVTDEVGRTDTASVVLSPTSATSIAPASATTKSCTATVPKALLAVCPATTSVQANGGTQNFTVTVANTTNDAVTWQVDDVPGGNATVGTITTAGVYTAPATVPSAAQVTVTAVSSVDQTIVSTSTVNITAPPSSHGGGAMDLWTLLVEGAALAVAFVVRRRALRVAAG